MRDRKIILPALIFLILIVGAGVNKSFVACSRMTGQPLAPGFNEMYRDLEQAADKKINSFNKYSFSR
ncbi:hypothetical protein [Phosphitispora sp. TUW77]|uniref:hypothetical protein n=1 Tax=Phosphitispora sp. TUW77 TaxID=3152361 RepID=UPI003AB2029A